VAQSPTYNVMYTYYSTRRPFLSRSRIASPIFVLWEGCCISYESYRVLVPETSEKMVAIALQGHGAQGLVRGSASRLAFVPYLGESLSRWQGVRSGCDSPA
jgi:hypothetical protein